MIRFDYEDLEDKPGLCRILRWEQDDERHVKDANPHQEVYQNDVPKAEALKRVGELTRKFNPS